MTLTTATSVSDVPANIWNALVSPNDPFTRHEFFLALEESGSVGEGTGWIPNHLLVWSDEALVAVVPFFLKSHSYGEYIFDWAWASSAHQNGIPYYPKFVSAIPFTPVTGRRILTGDRPLSSHIVRFVMEGLLNLVQQHQCSSLHLLFVTENEQRLMSQNSPVIPQITHQFHWKNQSYVDFRDWVSRFRSRRRKEVLRERKQIEKLGVTLHVLSGADLTDLQWQAIEEFYRDTVERKGGVAYLTPAFFQIMRHTLSDSVVAFVAEKEGIPVATSLCFQSGTHLYGRYWGCQEAYRKLHFELCYHRPIELCIEKRWTRFEAGAQGYHKIQRGLVPEPIYSVHWIAHRGLHQAVEQAVNRQSQEQLNVIEQLTNEGPFQRS